jgi:heterodisulfide reductase subunit A-like polyferredoxin
VIAPAELVRIEGEKGNFTAIIKKLPRYVDVDKCIACGICSEKCPAKTADEYNEGLNKRKAVYIPYAQAIPFKYAIDRDRCIYFKKNGRCKACEKHCPADAINFDDQEEEVALNTGAVILSTGANAFDAAGLDAHYHYRGHPDIMTSLEFERILSASGPTKGKLLRPSDSAPPRRIAWLQCIGSRDTARCGNGYCSSVCCMYAIKEAMIAKEHAHGDLECTIFYMDIRTVSKDYEKYYHRAKNSAGVRFVKSRIHAIDAAQPGSDIIIRYAPESGGISEEPFDLVVLSVGLAAPASAQHLAGQFRIDLNPYNFASTETFTPQESSRPGIYVCGSMQGPKDIPESITDASAAAFAAGGSLAPVRGTLTKQDAVAGEIDVAGHSPRIGVFVCCCGINIAASVDVEAVAAYAAELPQVVYSDVSVFTCSQDAQKAMREVIRKKGINRVVVAACSPKTHGEIFMDNLKAAGLNRYLFEMANIRNQNSWVHGGDPEEATGKAKELVRMAVSRCATLTPLHEKKIPINQRALVVGGGVAGMNAALGLADQGFEVALIEKEEQLGGLAARITHTIDGADVGRYLDDLVKKVTDHAQIQVLTQTLIVQFSGYKGNFTTEVLVGPGMYERKIEHGVALIATGATEYRPAEFSYGEHPGIMTQLELEARLKTDDNCEPKQVVMIQCVGSRTDANPDCSKVCCQTAVKNALALKQRNPDVDICVLYRDVRTYGLMEEYYTEARRLGVYFVRYDPDDPPVVEPSADDGIRVSFQNHVLGRRMTLHADLVALSAGMQAADTEELTSIMKLGRNAQGYFMEAHVKLRPVDMPTEGLFVCGTAQGPKTISESISQAGAAVSRATTFLSRPHLTLSAITATVASEQCAACLICVRACPFHVPVINSDGVSEIDEAQCQGCGVCAGECPAKAIELNWYEDKQLLSKVDALLKGVL